MRIRRLGSGGGVFVIGVFILMAAGVVATRPVAGPDAGRWKVNGTSCYWDANDSGPDQCDPNAGRWKLDGTTCSWDPWDSGPAQCDPNLGRWKLSGTTCSWDPWDSGPAQCDPNLGRWKLSGTTCSWDPWDSGAAQCDPNLGRWTLNGTTCSWDPWGSGAAQCSPNLGRWTLNGTTCSWDPWGSGAAQCDPNLGRWTLNGTTCSWDPWGSGPAQCDPNALELAVSGNHFTVNGTAKFLVFVSYFDALDVSHANLHSDFAYLKGKGIDGVRIFPLWWRMDAPYDAMKYFAQDTLIDPSGNLRSDRMTKFLEVLASAKEERLLVDVSFSSEAVGYCPPNDNCQYDSGIASLTLSEFTTALEAITTVLSNGGSAYKHVLFDIQNEANKDSNGPVGTRPLSDGQVDAIAEAVHAIEPNLPVTASLSSGFDAVDAAGWANSAEIDVATWHENRDPGWWNYTGTWVDLMQSITDLPVYLQEPAPYGDSAWGDPQDQGVVINAQEAKGHGAAAWCFHTRASQWLNGSTLYNRMDPVERAVLDALATALATTSWGI
jgi:hypothetical protein